MKPLVSAWNFSPSSTELASLADGLAGTAVLGQIVHGQADGSDVEVGVGVLVGVPGSGVLVGVGEAVGVGVADVPIVTATPADGVSRLALSSTARLLIVTGPEPFAGQLYDQFVVPVVGCQVAPPSTETST